MPKAFDKCVKEGGKVRTIKLNAREYRHICIDKEGNTHLGYVKKKKKGK